MNVAIYVGDPIGSIARISSFYVPPSLPSNDEVVCRRLSGMGRRGGKCEGKNRVYRDPARPVHYLEMDIIGLQRDQL